MESNARSRWPAFIAVGGVAMALGAGGAYLLLDRRTPTSSTTPAPSIAASVPPAAGGDGPVASTSPLPDVVVPLSEQAVARAGITTTTVAASAGAPTTLRVPAVIQPNAYGSVVVTPIAAGRITRVTGELGQAVRRGQILVDVYSPELAEAETRFLSVRAELAAHEQELRRTEKLAEIGAASRQEVERIHAEHAAATTMVESARARLRLLGVSAGDLEKLSPASELDATVHVTAPIDGVITARTANTGLNVDATTPLMTIVDVSTVWVVGELYERDFAAVRVGSAATVTTTAYPDLQLPAKVSYIDPQLKPDTRTAQLRVEVPNPKQQLRYGMYAEIQIAGLSSGAGALSVPKSAVQVVGNRSVVYLAQPNEPGKFVERDVEVGMTSGDQVQILAGLNAGDVVVSTGSFTLRAERERLGLRRTAAAAQSAASASASAAGPAAAQTARVTVTDQGYEPSRIALKANTPARVTFVRTSDKTCGTEITIPSLNIRRPLPLNQPVDIELTPTKGEITFVCGMGMLKGTIVGQ